MQHFIEVFFATTLGASICALGNRIRGGLWGDAIASRVHWGSTTARIVAWGGGCFLAALIGASIAHAGFLVCLLMIPLMWLGSTAPMFNAIDLGHNDGTFWTDFWHLTLHGVLCVAPSALVLPLFGYNPQYLIVTALMMAPAYFAAWQLRWNLLFFGVSSIDPPPMGEILFGALIGAALVVTFSLP